MLIEKRLACDRELHMIFVDLQKAYDTVPLAKLWEALHNIGVKRYLIRAIQELYKKPREPLYNAALYRVVLTPPELAKGNEHYRYI
uniref:Reverse transcriptase domain-containing protein n=1 Tax=Rhodnius prolixus TaxID=13249 RepID=T1HAV6_RHOPR